MKKPETKKEWAVYRCKITCQLGRNTCNGIQEIPAGIDRESWLLYNLFSAIENLAEAISYEGDCEKCKVG
jgi:hypothetical protein